MNIIILGPQGAGKGTQAELLAKKFGLYYLEMGKFLREIAKSNPLVDKIINGKGKLLPDGIVFSLMSEHIEASVPERDNILFDGYPRSEKQYGLLKEWLAEKKKNIDHAILLEIGEEESIKRLSARRMDKKTGKIYNLITNKPGPEVDESNLYHRPDDKPEAIKQRLKAYHEMTQPLIRVFEKEGILFRVDGSRPIDAIFQEIVNKIEQK